MNTDTLKQQLDRFEQYGELDTLSVLGFLEDFLIYVKESDKGIGGCVPVTMRELQSGCAVIDRFLELFADTGENDGLKRLDKLADNIANEIIDKVL